MARLTLTPDIAPAGWVGRLREESLPGVVGLSTFQRGRRYAVDGQVASVASADRGRVLVGTVLGHAPRPYQTLVTLVGEPTAVEPRWTARCSCPMVVQCKHAVAVLLTAKATLARQGPDATTGPKEGPSSWERMLGPLLDAPEQSGLSPLALILEETWRPSSPREGKPVRKVQLRPTRHTKTGRWAKNLAWSEVGQTYRSLPVDRRQLAALRAILDLARASTPHYYGYGSVAVVLDDLGPAVWPLIREAVDVGVELMTSVDVPGDVRLAPAARLGLDMTRVADGIRLRPTLQAATPDPAGPASAAGAEVSVLGNPPHALLVGRADGTTLVPLEGRPEAALLGLFTQGRSIDVPAGEVDLFLHLYQPQLRRSTPLTSSDGSVQATEPRPPRLQVRVAPGDGHRLELTFGFAYEAGERRRVVPAAETAVTTGGMSGGMSGAERGGRPGRHPVPRDSRAEQELLARLDVLDGIPGCAGVAGAARSAHSAAAGPRTPARLPAVAALDGMAAAWFVTETLPLLEAEQEVVVEIVGELPAYEQTTEAPLVQVATSDSADSTDWFDLSVSVEIDGEEVPFEALFTALARGDDAMLLASGRWFRLDHPSFARLRELIAEARELADPTSSGLRISRYHVGFWEELVSLGVVTRQSERWSANVQALRDYEGDEPPEVPAALDAKLRPYQLTGYHWLSAIWDARLGGILADDMGLGKTLQALALLVRAQERGELETPVLVVAPTSVVGTWAREAARFAPGLAVTTVAATSRRRGTSLAEEAAGAGVVITSYAVLRIDAAEFRSVPWRGVLLDEAQFVKNHQSKTYQAVRRLGAPFTLALTGTPLENSLMDLWSMLSLVAPGLYPRPDRFTELYRRPIESGEQPELLARLRRRIRPLMLRRTKEAVATELPPKQIQVLQVPLHPVHERIYGQHLQRERQRVLGMLADPDGNRVAILASLTRLRQLSLDPALVDDAYAGKAASAKVEAVLDLLTEIAREGHRALVFSQFTGFLRVVRQRLAQEGLDTCYLDGRTRNREKAIDAFRTGAAPAFLISLKAGGFGLTLTEADYVFILDPWWNPAAEAQAIDRTHRIGQDKHVMVYRLVSTGTIEEKVVALQQRKQALFDRVVDGEGGLDGGITAEDIRALLGASES